MNTKLVCLSNATVRVGNNRRYLIFGDNDTVLVGKNSAVAAFGAGLSVTCDGADDVIVLGGNGQAATGAAVDFVHGLTGGTLFELPQSNVSVDGSNYSAFLTGWDTLTASGDGVKASVAGAHNTLVLSGDDDVVGVFAHSSLNLVGSAIHVSLLGDDTLSVQGGGCVIDDAGSSVGGDNIFLGANHVYRNLYANDVVTLHNAGDSVTLANYCGAELNNAGSAGPVAITLGGQGSLWLTGAFALFDPAGAGADTIRGFGAEDTLALAAHFDDAAALLAATTALMTGCRIDMPSAGDSLTLLGVDKTAFASYVNAGRVTFS